MQLALSLAARGRGRTWPNPAVGCVIVKQGRIVGRGWTQPSGRPHAEVVALAQAGDQAEGATAYVTLEPCAHHGKTPPCADALVRAGIGRVICAAGDSDERVSGRGFEILRSAGVKVEQGILEKKARDLNKGFFAKVEKGRPMVTLKLANSFDGRIATASGESQWITGAQARREVHRQRSSHDAVMVGAGTARADDPSLNVRDLGVSYQPTRIVVSRKLDIPMDGKLAKTAREIPVILCHGADADPDRVARWTALGAQCLSCDMTSFRQLDPASVLTALGGIGLTRVFCEGGGQLAASLLSAGLVDEIIGFTAGVVLGAEGQPSLGAMGVEQLSQAPRFELLETRRIGGDVLHRWCAT
ncbi:bifunctional diaminohydroxyphosphoribosylaminopyrimidine deaminase/5-amino-6-(5-phosphoribosylamino)uracil reductase RibD [Cochlodiniinecator piscidefendens]|uniref:bifunctional diaminohydroxyphosphoribosylaminopyrimidine deaminase/5-amino-6-(5-phosphoribosylamino)uracil reductase RibD n=1 Tax=Cochlodiniinecator piscidefendens TaxID=2715756 RepID=UPI001407FD3F